MWKTNIKELPNTLQDKKGWPWHFESHPTIQREGATPPSPCISIITPSFNQAEYIEETIRSVLLQGYSNLQYIVIDGGSLDGSKELIRKYEAHLDHWISEPDSGQTEAINKGLSRAKGDWLMWLNSDDILLPEALTKIAAAIQENPGAHWLVGNTLVTDAKLVPKNRFEPVIGHLSKDRFPDTHGTWLDYVCTKWSKTALPQPSSIWSRHAWSKTGALDESLRYVMDFDYWTRMAFEGFAPIRIESDLAGFRHHDVAKTAQGKIPFWLEEIEVIKRWIPRASLQDQAILDEYQDWLVRRVKTLQRRRAISRLPFVSRVNAARKKFRCKSAKPR